MRFIFILLFFVLLCKSTFAQIIAMEGGQYIIAKELPLERLTVYVVNHPPHSLILSAESSTRVRKYKEDALHSEIVEGIYRSDLRGWEILNPEVDCAYFIEQDGYLPHYYYLLNYQNKQWNISNLKVAPEQLCGQIRITWDGIVSPLLYKTPLGETQSLSRSVQLAYNDLFWDEVAKKFIPRNVELEVIPNQNHLSLEGSLTSTAYTFGPDTWQFALGMVAQKQQTNVLEPTNSKINSFVYSLSSLEETALIDQTYSAPLLLRHEAYSSSDGQRYLWRIWRVDAQGRDESMVYNSSLDLGQIALDQSGRYHMILEVFSVQSECNKIVYEQFFDISSSKLEIPNAFTPYSSPGVNDLFRVHAVSIVKFRGVIISPNGQIIYQWTKPEEGWDGLFHGRKMPAGVYYYVIEAEGADGVGYRRKGSLNLMNQGN